MKPNTIYICEFDVGRPPVDNLWYSIPKYRTTTVEVLEFGQEWRTLEAVLEAASPTELDFVFAVYSHETVDITRSSFRYPVAEAELGMSYGFRIHGPSGESFISRRLFPVKGDGHTDYLTNTPGESGWLVPAYVGLTGSKSDTVLGHIHAA